MKLQHYQLTSCGDREINQDYMLHHVRNDYALFVVADGLGGHHAGEKAAKYFCQGLLALVPEYRPKMLLNPQITMSSWVDAAIDKMAESFSGDSNINDAHTTCAILYIQKEFVVIAHCGDSRVYRLSQNGSLWRTKDHSMTQDLLEKGQITEQQMGIHPDQNILTRSINCSKSHQTEVNVYTPAEKGETFIICSDGFWEYTKKNEFQQLATFAVEKKGLLKQAQLAMIRANGKSDNVTVQWLRIVA